MDFPGSITERGTLKQTPIVSESRKQYLATLKAGTNVIETIKVVRRGKTWEQCKTIFGLAFMTIERMFEDRGWDSSTLLNINKPTGIAITDDMLKIYFYSMYPVFRDDKQITLRKMTTTEASGFYNSIQNWSASQWSIVIPDPDPNWKEKGGGSK